MSGDLPHLPADGAKKQRLDGGSNATPNIVPPQQNRPRFPCPLCSDKDWSSLPQLQNHIEKFHLGTGVVIPEDFLRAYNRRVCGMCQKLALSNGLCRMCKLGPHKRQRDEANDMDVSEQAMEDAAAWESVVDLPKGTLRFVPGGVVQA